MEGINHFGMVDYIAVAGTLLFSLGIGVFYAIKSKNTNEEMLVGGRSMNPIPIAASMMVTYLSAITILGYPAEVYAYGSQIFMITLIGMVAIPISSYLFVPVFYKLRLTSVYEYLELRFESIVVRWLASFTFILQIVLINGVVLYAPAIALQAIVGFPIWLSVTGIGVIGTIYTSIGGIKAVVWTDCFQFLMIIVGMVSIVTKALMSAGGLTNAFSIAAEKGRLELFDFTVDPFMRHNTLNFVLGFGFTSISLYGTHQPQVQRYCSLPTLKDAIKAILFTIPMNVFTMSLVIFTGVCVFATYSGCCPILLGKIHRADSIIPYFVLNELAFIPGMMGIFVSCIFSAVLSSVSSTLNSLAAVTWEDFLSKIPLFKNMKPNAQSMCTRTVSLLYGIISVLAAFVAQNLGAIFQLVMTAVGATSGPLGGIFIAGLFMPFINKFGAIAGMIVGLTSMIYVAMQSFILTRTYNFLQPLPTDLDDCPADTVFSHARNYTAVIIPDLPYPEKLYTVSYILYPFIGALITLSVAILVSLFTGGFCSYKKVNRKYLHPFLYNFKSYSVPLEKEMMDIRPYKYDVVSNSGYYKN